MSKQAPPTTEQQLMDRVMAIAGLRIKDLASAMAVPVPENLQRKKGFVGQLIEMALGADAGNQAEPDFIQLSIELKTVPVDRQYRPMESTYVSVVPLMDKSKQHWEESVVFAKLKQVLWIPIEASRDISLPERRIGRGILWRPDARVLAELQQDYEELMEQVILGEVDNITAEQGKWLQIRPKAANSSALTQAIGPEGERIKTLPRGFYLRPTLTRQILAEQ